MGAFYLATGASHLAMGAFHLAMGASHLATGAFHLAMGASHLATGAFYLALARGLKDFNASDIYGYWLSTILPELHFH